MTVLTHMSQMSYFLLNSVRKSIIGSRTYQVPNWRITTLIFFLLFQVFREHNIDGSALPLLTEDHLTLRLGLKLGPALKLKSIITKKLGPAHADICVHCAHCNSKMAENNEATNGQTLHSVNSSEEPRSASRTSSLGEK